jgi:hypothetical protein
VVVVAVHKALGGLRTGNSRQETRSLVVFVVPRIQVEEPNSESHRHQEFLVSFVEALLVAVEAEDIRWEQRRSPSLAVVPLKELLVEVLAVGQSAFLATCTLLLRTDTPVALVVLVMPFQKSFSNLFYIKCISKCSRDSMFLFLSSNPSSKYLLPVTK